MVKGKVKFQIFKYVYRHLARLDLAAIFILVILLLIAFGACFPQRPTILDPKSERLAQWDAIVRARYGDLMDALNASGVFNWYRAPKSHKYCQ